MDSLSRTASCHAGLYIILRISMDFQRFYIMDFSTMDFYGLLALLRSPKEQTSGQYYYDTVRGYIYGSSAEMSQSWVYHSANLWELSSVTHILIGINPHSYSFRVHPPLIEISRTKFL